MRLLNDIDDNNCQDDDSDNWFLYPTSNDTIAPSSIGSSQHDSPIWHWPDQLDRRYF